MQQLLTPCFLVGPTLFMKFIVLSEVCFWPCDLALIFLMFSYVFVLAERFWRELCHMDYSTLLHVQFEHHRLMSVFFLFCLFFICLAILAKVALFVIFAIRGITWLWLWRSVAPKR